MLYSKSSSRTGKKKRASKTYEQIKKELEEHEKKEKKMSVINTYRLFMVIALYVLRVDFQFGPTRAKKFLNACIETNKKITNGELSSEKMEAVIKSELKMNL